MLLSVMRTQYVFCEAETELLNIIYIDVRLQRVEQVSIFGTSPRFCSYVAYIILCHFRPTPVAYIPDMIVIRY
jgi:hypothetical protein